MSANRPAENRGALAARAGSLVIARGDPAASDSQLFLAMLDDGTTWAFNGHVDLGTGIRTALAQIVAEELDLAVADITMVLGDTQWAPSQGATIASETIQITAVPLRRAAAQARLALIALAAQRLGVPADGLSTADGAVIAAGAGAPGDAADNRRLPYRDLLAGQRLHLELDDAVAVKATADYRVVGRSEPRVDLPAKATGELTFVHDMRVPGMVHGRVVRPPYVGRDTGAFVANSLRSIDETSIAHIPGILAVVVIRDFIGIVAEREEDAARAANEFVVEWASDWPTLPDLENPEAAIRANPASARILLDRGDVDAALAGADRRLTRTYVWPYQMHASIGPCASLADWRDGRLTVWSGSQAPLMLRADLAKLLGIAPDAVEVIRMEASGCYGRNSMDDVGADAALLAHAVGRPVRVQLTREQEHGWEPKGSAQVMDVDGGLTAEGEVAGYDYNTRCPTDLAPTLALFLTGIVPAIPIVADYGDRTAIPPYQFDDMRVVVHDMPTIVRAAWLRGVSALPSTFAHESYIDELATEAGVDPIAFRLRYLHDPRGIDVARATAERAGWAPRTGPRRQVVGHDPDGGEIVRGQGFAYALYVHSKFPGYGAAWAAWVADVEVKRATGEVVVTRVTVGQDSGLIVNPDGVRHQINGNVVQSISRVLHEEVSFDANAVVSRDWGGYPILTMPEVPPVDIQIVPRPDQPPLGVGESTSVPSAAAIANAVFDATGVRFRELPLTPERVLFGLRAAGAAAEAPLLPAPAPAAAPARRGWRRRWVAALGIAAAATGAVTASFQPWRSPIAPIAPPDRSVFSAETIERGRVLAEAGDCAVCHTREGGTPNTGGRPLETPFGTIFTTNLTPDPKTGIGGWSYPAFERAMREGVGRDGRHLYPAFPYTAFTRMTDADLQSLYAYLMAQPAVPAETPANALRFPFNLRPLLAGWKGMFLETGAFQADPAHSDTWNRGAYLVEAVGHCSACHSPRNALGAERRDAPLAGGFADGWEAPAIGSRSTAPIPWSKEEYTRYLRTGTTRHHGSANGPMAPVIAGLAALPDADIAAMAEYLAAGTEATATDTAAQTATAARLRAQTDARLARPAGRAGRMFANACGSCHTPAAAGERFGGGSPLELVGGVHSDRPDNFLRAVLDGLPRSYHPDGGAMPSFRDSFTDRQLADLAAYVRATHAPGRPAWQDLEAAAARIRATPAH